MHHPAMSPAHLERLAALRRLLCSPSRTRRGTTRSRHLVCCSRSPPLSWAVLPAGTSEKTAVQGSFSNSHASFYNPCRPSAANRAGSLSSVPILLRFALHRRCLRVLEFQPVLRPAGSVARPEPLRDDAFASELAGVSEHEIAGLRQVLVQPQARQTSAQQAR